ncbi:dehydrogenase/reductase SDR family member 11-like [Paramacrobiotus metropolitanus]|uniref:dehydrogenase/reductase SDR family member 11-like n=1 Tax=Paramacrobiotus metropolitanus TaxID=2943436 RepID=UPI0024465213|nr:dehydrogenase/reductase SDR family member 11-like [Paramacrobiotus metropolitanus]
MERWRGRTALVTGASSGIGYAIAEALAQKGVKVIGCARNIAKIQEIAKKYKGGPGYLEAIQCDISKPEHISAMFEQIVKQHGYVDVLVNNAGLNHMDTLMAGRTEKWREIFEVNVLGLCICAREALKLMQNNGIMDGSIININSLSGHAEFHFPETHFYSGTKHMVTSLTESLHREVRAMEPRNSIRITDISPGIVITEITDRSASDVDHAVKPPAAFTAQYQKLDASDIADCVVYVLSAPQHVNVKTLIVCPTQQPEL